MRCLIDKTAAVEEALARFPAVYIEGAAASGKSTAVRMMLAQHSGIASRFYYLNKMDLDQEKLHLLKQKEKKQIYYIFENISSALPVAAIRELAEFVRELPDGQKAVFLSREQPPGPFLDLIWKRQMESISQKELLFSLKEIQHMVRQEESSLDPEELYAVTGGWPGCVDLMIRLAGKTYGAGEGGSMTVRSLRQRHEIDAYIKEEILQTLSGKEQQVMKIAAICPWISESLCREAGGPDDVRDCLKSLERKGLLIRENQKKYWRAAPLFQESGSQNMACGAETDPDRQRLAKILMIWYEGHGFQKEAIGYYRQSSDPKEWCEYLIRHYEKIPFSGITYKEILKYRTSSPQAAYLRGMYCRESGDFRKISWEASNIGADDPEIYLNLMFANPEVSLDEWLELAMQISQQQKEGDRESRFRLYDLLGSSHTYLCGIRDLSGLFVCTKKEENRKARIWKTVLGEAEWRAYCLARINFYLETERAKDLREEDKELLAQISQELIKNQRTAAGRKENAEGQRWKDGIVCLYLNCLMEMIHSDENRRDTIFRLADALRQTEHPICVRNTEAVMGTFAYILKYRESLGGWMLAEEDIDASEMTCTEHIFRNRGYIILRQYGKAAGLLEKSTSYLKKYRLTRLYAEALFQQAVVNWSMEQRGQAIQNVIESFLVNGSCRYVTFYTVYRSPGLETLTAYLEWMQNNIPGGWKRKKKYNYGNVLRMPLEDYLNLVLRKAKHSLGKEESFRKDPEKEDNLTMMETIILQAICQGLSNAEISKQQNLKISTVKSHIYSMYKKLGVKNRMQAALKGRELGLV